MTRHRIALAWISFGAIAVAVAPSIFSLAPVLLWNASASVPIGFYEVHRVGEMNVGDLAVARPPENLAKYLARRRSLPKGVFLIKPVSAIAGQTVCRHGRQISVDGRSKALALEHDRIGRPLPVWRGCHRLETDELFLMNAARSDSLDGRYFGALPTSTIVGRATRLWLVKAS